MIFEKRPGVWKSSFSPVKFKTKEEAEAWEAGVPLPKEEEPASPKQVETTVSSEWSPLEKLRGWKETCTECGCDPCECEEEWNSVEETSSETESSKEDLS